MPRLKIGDRIRITGGYDMNPPWLNGGSGYDGVVTGFFENEIQKRHGDSAISVAIEFDNEIECKGVKAKYGYLLTRYADQIWESENHGIHVYLSKLPISNSADILSKDLIWAESHAGYRSY